MRNATAKNLNKIAKILSLPSKEVKRMYRNNTLNAALDEYDKSVKRELVKEDGVFRYKQ